MQIINANNANLIVYFWYVCSAFDFVCEKHGAQKIETVGKTYMAATGIKECEVDIDNNLKQKGKGERLVNMAKDMLDIA